MNAPILARHDPDSPSGRCVAEAVRQLSPGFVDNIKIFFIAMAPYDDDRTISMLKDRISQGKWNDAVQFSGEMTMDLWYLHLVEYDDTHDTHDTHDPQRPVTRHVLVELCAPYDYFFENKVISVAPCTPPMDFLNMLYHRSLNYGSRNISPNRMKNRSTTAAGAVLVAIALIWGYARFGHRHVAGVWNEYHGRLTNQRVPGINPTAIMRERRARVQAIADSLNGFRTHHDRYPASMEEWRAFEPDADALLETPPLALGRYHVNFELLGMDAWCLVVVDPGIAWPEGNAPPNIPGTPHHEGDMPVGLYADGSIAVYFDEEYRNTIRILKRIREGQDNGE